VELSWTTTRDGYKIQKWRRKQIKAENILHSCFEIQISNTVFAIADSVPVIYRNHGIRVRGGIGFSVNNVNPTANAACRVGVRLPFITVENYCKF
jgi:hypothetical protein